MRLRSSPQFAAIVFCMHLVAEPSLADSSNRVLVALARSEVKANKLSVDADGYCFLDVSGVGLTSLSAFAHCPIRVLYLRDNNLRDLSPLRGMPLRELDLCGNPIQDISPLSGMPLRALFLAWFPERKEEKERETRRWALLDALYSDGGADSSRSESGIGSDVQIPSATNGSAVLGVRRERLVTDLAPLKGVPLEVLVLRGLPVRDLSPLRGLPLRYLDIRGTDVTDLSPLRSMPLETLGFSPSRIVKGLESMRRMRSLTLIWYSRTGACAPAEVFWKMYDAGEFEGGSGSGGSAVTSQSRRGTGSRLNTQHPE